MGVGVFMTAVNAGVLVLLVDGFGMLPVAANLSRVAFTTQLHFLLHRKFTWKGNHVTTLWQQWYRYHLLKVLSVLMGQLGFMLFYLLAGLPCVLAFLASITLVGVLNLLLFDKLVFMLAKK
ncbi:MAG: GtrA family protein [Candidatus Woesebacteria bacterium]|jgi:putative flippase GtrA